MKKRNENPGSIQFHMRTTAFLLSAILLLTAGCGAKPTNSVNSPDNTQDAASEADAGNTPAAAQNAVSEADAGNTPDAAQDAASETDAGNTPDAAQDAASETDAGDTPDAAPAPLTDYVDEACMALADRWAGCDDRALAAVMRKAEAGEPVTIACIGGSITQGTVSAGSSDASLPSAECYASLFFAWWEAAFPQTEFTFINAGVGATDSYLGVHRVKRDVLAFSPDLVLVEFSVNDAGSSNAKRTYDNLVRRILLSESRPAVMLLFMGQTNGATAQDVHALVGFHYQLPMVSYSNVISALTAQKTYDAGQLSGDTTHPSALGHAIAGEILWRYLGQVYAKRNTLDDPEPFSRKALTKDTYTDSELLDSASLAPDALGSFEKSSVFEAFPNDYTCTSGDGGLTFAVNCTRLGILYYRTTDGSGGQFEIYVDGEYVRTLDADFSGGWGNYAEAEEVFVSEQTAPHKIEIKKAADSTGDAFTVLGVLTAR